MLHSYPNPMDQVLSHWTHPNFRKWQTLCVKYNQWSTTRHWSQQQFFAGMESEQDCVSTVRVVGQWPRWPVRIVCKAEPSYQVKLVKALNVARYQVGSLHFTFVFSPIKPLF